MVATGSVTDSVVEQLAVANRHLGLLEHMVTIGLSLVLGYIVLMALWWALSRLIYYI